MTRSGLTLPRPVPITAFDGLKNATPPKSLSQCLQPVNVTPQGKGDFADVIKGLKMGTGSWMTWGGGQCHMV